MIAVCGLDCAECDIFQAVDNSRIAQRIADWLRRERGIEVSPEDIYCDGCRGDREQHWSPECWILKCCIDDEGLEFCHECEDFPCQKLNEWVKGSERYSDALEKLWEMRMR